MTPYQIDLARHALGLNRQRVSFRNYFVAGPGHNDYAGWMDMVEKGVATRRPGGLGTCAGDFIFALTRAGAEAAMRPGEKIDPEWGGAR